VAPVTDGNSATPLDGRIIAYRIVKFAVIVLLCAGAVKLFVLDTVLVRTDQMEPALADGDRVLVFKLLRVWPLSEILLPFRASPVVFANPLLQGKPSVLRVAAVSGDSVVIRRGSCRILNKRAFARSSLPAGEEPLPPEYSPRDSMPLYVLPAKGTTVALDSLPLRDFFFAAGLIRQENPGEQFMVRPSVFVNGAPVDTLYTRDFSLYKGRIDSVPNRYEFDWFFWDRMRDYLSHSQTGKEITLAFSLMRSGERMYGYTFTRSSIFLLADDWQKGFDSRYFGPVVASSVKGRVLGVLWSFGRSGDHKSKFRISRFFKIIR
jgi:signal peptidase I